MLRTGKIVGTALLLGLLIVAVLPQIWHPFSRDHGELSACAQVLLRGGALYRDCWENKGPLTYPFFMLPAAIAPSIFALRLFDALWQALTSIVLAQVLGRMVGHSAGVLAGIGYWVFYITSGFWNTMQSETFTALFVALNIFFAWRSTVRAAFFAGVCAGILGWAKYVFVLMGLGTALALLLQVWLAQHRIKPVLQHGLAYVLGVLLISVTVIAYLALGGALPAFVRHLEFLSGPFAVARSPADTFAVLWAALRGYLNDGIHIGPLPKATVLPWDVLGHGFPILIVLALFAVWQQRRNPSLWYFGLAWLMGFVCIIWQARYSTYHFMVLLLPLVALATLAAQPKPAPADSGAGKGLRFALSIAIAAALLNHAPLVQDWFANVIAQGKTPTQMHRETSMADEWLLRDWVVEHTTTQDKITIWGIAASTYFISQRQNATSFNFVLPFEYQSRFRASWIAQFVQELEANRPKYFIISKDGYPTPNYSAQKSLREATPIFDYIEKHYVYVGESTVFLLYERR